MYDPRLYNWTKVVCLLGAALTVLAVLGILIGSVVTAHRGDDEVVTSANRMADLLLVLFFSLPLLTWVSAPYGVLYGLANHYWDNRPALLAVFVGTLLVFGTNLTAWVLAAGLDVNRPPGGKPAILLPICCGPCCLWPVVIAVVVAIGILGARESSAKRGGPHDTDAIEDPDLRWPPGVG